LSELSKLFFLLLDLFRFLLELPFFYFLLMLLNALKPLLRLIMEILLFIFRFFTDIRFLFYFSVSPF
jgi:hypothetical protein